MQKKDSRSLELERLKENIAFKNHILTKKSKKRKLKLTHDGLVNDSDLPNIKKQLRLK